MTFRRRPELPFDPARPLRQLPMGLRSCIWLCGTASVRQLYFVLRSVLGPG